jgi:hypothetical protein
MHHSVVAVFLVVVVVVVILLNILTIWEGFERNGH